MDKITIMSVFNKHEDFIEVQYNSITKNEIVDIEHNRFESLYIGLNEKFFSLYQKIVDYGFPKPYFIDIINVDGVDTIIHFKSSNHDVRYGDLDYTKNKKISLSDFLKDN